MTKRVALEIPDFGGEFYTTCNGIMAINSKNFQRFEETKHFSSLNKALFLGGGGLGGGTLGSHDVCSFWLVVFFS